MGLTPEQRIASTGGQPMKDMRAPEVAAPAALHQGYRCPEGSGGSGPSEPLHPSVCPLHYPLDADLLPRKERLILLRNLGPTLARKGVVPRCQT